MKQHANATTTVEMREFIQESDLPTAVLARLLKISESTVRKWRRRETVDDKSHIPKQLNTTLTPAQEYVIVELACCFIITAVRSYKRYYGGQYFRVGNIYKNTTQYNHPIQLF